MRETLNELEQWGTEVIFGRARGFRATVMRILLWALSGIYRIGVAVRLKCYRKGAKYQHYLGTQVISIGNLTVGGTGKTPMVEMFARTLRERGRKPAILSRGYKSKRLGKPQEWLRKSNGLPIPADEMPKVVSAGGEPLIKVRYAGDEPWMLAKNLPGVSVIVDKNRVKGGSFAVGELNADTLILDDGLQYLNLAHTTDVVLVDQNSPFGTGRILPRGTLREPAKNLRRADYIFITKCDGSSNEQLITKMRRYNRHAEIIECTHGPQHLENIFTGEQLPLDYLQKKYVAAISGIAVPQSFEKILKSLGARVEFHRVFSDHHTFNQKDIDRFMNRCVRRDIELIVTTEKDAVRFPRPAELDVPIYFLRIEVDILKGMDVWERLIDRICDKKGNIDPILLRQMIG
ncbi:MAG TPA: tetraacyldisaccharide 4'-kinase [Verrucomicrobiales bacterium]|jgi:tetraacyldisaccharide 4'-kinase|nr:tetraacyldisaccharide 4'-kinase [Verrucomicrobiales bacterium]HCI91949.1 tetraacyldisaccharide 4'-kinase [Verrucomicrobiales bacterium]HCL96966.1 tetraacyldisaccharide 4'-kinase [Verrucomicrobiales bacterium]